VFELLALGPPEILNSGGTSSLDLRVDLIARPGGPGEGSLVSGEWIGVTDDPLLRPNFDTAALLTIDVQHDTLDGEPGEIPGTTEVLPTIRKLASAFREAGRPIVHVVRLYLPDGSNVDLCRRQLIRGGARMFLPGSRGAELADGVAPALEALDAPGLLSGQLQPIGGREAVMYKPRWGAFFRTPLQAHLEAQHVDTLVFCGANFPNCPRTSIYEASERDYRIVVAADAVSRLAEAGVRELQAIGVHVWSVQRLSSQLALAPRPAGV
jgi:nicotinamidase-related amidase